MINIRRATAEDIDTLQELNFEVFKDNFTYDDDLDLDWSKSDKGKNYYSEAISNQDAVCLIAEENGKAVGYLSGGPSEQIGRKSKYYEIYDMGVSPSYRSKGIGKLLINECFSIAKSKGFQRIIVKVYFDNTKAIEFYKRAGLKEIEIGMEKAF